MSTNTRLNTTAYSLLGLLAKKPWSAYELTQFMGDSVLKHILPRTKSQLYSEPKKLASLGLITQTQEIKQGRERTLYKITPQGRKIFNLWLSEPGENVKIEYKSLLKFYLTNPENPKALRTRVEEMRQQAFDDIQQTLALFDHINEKGLILNQTAVVASMISRLGNKQFKARLEWLDEVDNWLDELIQNMTEEKDLMAWSSENYQRTRTQLTALLKKHQTKNK